MPLSINGGPLTWEADINLGQFMQKLNQIEGGIHGITKASEKEMHAMDSLVKKATGALAAYASFAAAGSFISDIVKVRGEFQKLEAVLTNSLGDNNAAVQALEMISDYAATTPFQLQELGAAYVKLVNQGIKPTREELTALGDLAASTGKDFGQLAEAIIDAQTGEFERLKEFGIRASKEGENVKFTFKGVETQVKFTSEAIKNYITGLGQMQGVAGATAAISATLGGQLSNLADNWSKMLNSLGQSSEGTISKAISFANTLVENYETVLDILKVLVATYGTYRAALMLTTVASATLGATTKGLTALQILQAGATGIAQRAMALLNRTILANPAVAIATAIGTLVAALIVFRKEADAAGSKAKLLADAQSKISNSMADMEAKIRPYMEALKNANLSEEQRVHIYNKLQEIDPKIVAGLDAKTLSYEKLAKNVDIYLASLRKQIALEANQEAAEASVKQELDFQKQIDAKTKSLASFNKALDDHDKGIKKLPQAAKANAELAVQRLTREIKELETLKKKQQDVTNSLATEIVPPDTKTGAKALADFLADQENLLTRFNEYIKLVQNKGDAEAVKKALIAKMESFAPGDQAKEAYKKRINEVNALLKKYTVDDPNKTAKAAEAIDNKALALLEKRKDILQAINEIQQDAQLSGRSKEASIIEGINDKYDKLIEKVQDYQQTVDKWNQKNPKNQVARIGQSEIDKINQARQVEITNQQLKEDVVRYEKSLKEKAELYKQYQAAVQEVGKSDADKLYADEKLAFDNYLDYLKFEIGKFGTQISLGVKLNLADEGKLKLLTEQLKTVSKEQVEQQIADTKRVMLSTLNAAEQRKVLEANYLKDVETLRKTYTGKDLEERERVLKQSLDNDLIALASHLGEQTELYRKMNKGVYDMARQRIDNEIAQLEKQLQAVKDTDPGLAAAIQQAIDKWKDLKKEMTGTLDTMDKVEAIAQELGPAFSDLGNSVAPLNEGLANSLSLIGSVLSGVKQAAASFKQFQAQQKAMQAAEKGSKLQGALGMVSAGLGMVGAVVGVVSAIAGVFKKAKEERERAREEERQRLMDIYRGEIEINALYRERARTQADMNRDRLQGIKDEIELLGKQKEEIQKQVADIFRQLAMISDPRAAIFGGSNPFPYAGKTFEELEKLDAQGLLKDKAKELFDILAKLRQEGQDVDQMIKDLQKETDQRLTGTTSNQIADAIVEGFKQGKRSAKDFADTFEQLMQDAALSAFKSKVIQENIDKFYEQFAEAARSSSGLTQEKIEELRKAFSDQITNIGQQFDQLQQITGLNLSGGGSLANQANSLQGAIKGMTEQTAELLAGQMGGTRLALLELVKINTQNLSIQTRIQANTAATVTQLQEVVNTMHHYFTSGIKIK